MARGKQVALYANRVAAVFVCPVCLFVFDYLEKEKNDASNSTSYLVELCSLSLVCNRTISTYLVEVRHHNLGRPQDLVVLHLVQGHAVALAVLAVVSLGEERSQGQSRNRGLFVPKRQVTCTRTTATLY